ncbi:hypothetical protein [Brevibacillus reuszeri]|nr:hypothetical protein [Brevibacillus reuszeri]MED1860020.1 hypothetical protein [Brevibacillus reuszeri]
MQQAKLSNKSSRVILLGTPDTRSMCHGSIEHFLISDHFSSAQQFKPIYQHRSTNQYAYSLFNFQRWFILKDFMHLQSLDSCLVLDSDVLLYTSIDSSDFHSFSMEFSWTSFVSREMAYDFCSYVMKQFQTPALLSRAMFYAKKLGHGLLSDMILCDLFHLDHPELPKCFGLFSDCFFDHNLNCPLPDYLFPLEQLAGKKKVYLLNNQLYCKKVGTDELLYVCSLHFQGAAKQFLKYFFSPRLSARDSSTLFFFDYLTSQWVPAT